MKKLINNGYDKDVKTCKIPYQDTNYIFILKFR